MWGLTHQLVELRKELADLKERHQSVLEVHQNRLDELRAAEAEMRLDQLIINEQATTIRALRTELQEFRNGLSKQGPDSPKD